MEPLSDAVCQAANWLKSSVERLSEKGPNEASKADPGTLRQSKRAENGSHGGSWGHATGTSGTFRTVSEGEF